MANATATKPQANTDAKTAKTRAPRREPKLVGTTDEIPPSQRNGFWVNEVKKFMAQPGKVFTYTDVSPTTASTLRKDHGLDAQSRTEQGEGGEKRIVLYVRYVPERVDEIKEQVRKRGEKRTKAAKAAAQSSAK